MKRMVSIGVISLAGLGFGAAAHAQDSFQNVSDATGASVEAASQVVAAGGQVALGAVAVPLAIAGAGAESTGNAANTIAGDLWDAANAPLVVDEDIALAAEPLPEIPRAPDTQSANGE